MLRKILALLLAAALCLSFAACGEAPGTEQPDPTGDPLSGGESAASALSNDPAAHFTDRDLAGTWEECVNVTLSDSGSTADGDGVNIDGSTVTVTRAGTYRFTGSLSQGQLRVSVGEQDKVQLVLENVSVSCTGGPALYILSGDKIFVTLADGSENHLETTGEFTNTAETNLDGAVFSKSDVTFNGTGSLAVTCETAHGMVSKDDMKITGGTYTVTAAKQGISGKDSLRICGGDITVNSGTDGLRSKNDEDAARGYIYISGGTWNITAGGDGMDASGEILIVGGTFTVFTGEGSDSVTHSDGSWGGGMMGGWPGGWEDTQTDTDAVSCKAVKAGTQLTLTGGTFTLDSQDDALHCGGDLTVSGGEYTIASGDDALHADGALTVSNGNMEITKSYEGLEGTYITVSGGDIRLTASDDGMNAAGGNDGSGMAGPWGQGGFGEATDAYILISGGTLRMDAGGDGIDSNGDLTVTGGTVYLDGPENSGNGALDYAGTGTITGGTVVALGASGMAMNFGTSSTQGAILCGLNGTAPADTEVTLKDAEGNLLASYTSGKSFQSILISAPGVEVGKTYTVSVGSASADITMDSVIYGSGSGMGGGMGGGPGGMGGGRPGGR